MKRRLFQLAAFLVLGAVVNVAVAWGCLLLPDLPPFFVDNEEMAPPNEVFRIIAADPSS